MQGRTRLEVNVKVKAEDKRAKWKRMVEEEGRVLLFSEIDGLSLKALSAYLRAMDVTVSREQQKNSEQMRDLLKRVMKAQGVREWTCAKSTEGECEVRTKRQKAA